MSETGEEEFVRISRLAVGSLFLSMIGLLGILSFSFVPIAILATVCALVACIRVAQNQSLGGGTAAIIALALGTMTTGWSIAETTMTNKKLYAKAAEHAKLYLQTLAQGDTYQAMEMRKEEQERQVAGTKLNIMYASGRTKEQGDMDQFLADPITQDIINSGPKSDWQFVRGLDITRKGLSQTITVKMANEAGEGEEIIVAMKRATQQIQGSDAALWNVILHTAKVDK